MTKSKTDKAEPPKQLRVLLTALNQLDRSVNVPPGELEPSSPPGEKPRLADARITSREPLGDFAGDAHRWRALVLASEAGWGGDSLKTRLGEVGIAEPPVALVRLLATQRLATPTPESLDQLYQQLLRWDIETPLAGDPWRARPGDHRRRQGAHYTPRALARQVALKAMGPLLERVRSPRELFRLRICDPACGSGVFLAEVRALLLERLVELGGDCTPLGELERKLTSETLTGLDLDPVALLLAHYRLGPARASLRCSDALALGPPADDGTIEGHWQGLFPAVIESGGFDAIVGNPPWVAYAGRAAQPLAAARSGVFAAGYRAFARYRTLHGLFIEQCARGIKVGGRLGLVLPTSVSDLEGYGPTRLAHDLFATVDSPLLDFGDGVFDGVSQPCMALTSTRTEPVAPAQRVWQLSSGRLPAAAEDLLTKLKALPACAPELFGERGYQTAGADRGLLQTFQPEASRPGWAPLLTGTEVREYQRGTPRQWVEIARLQGRFRPSSQWQAVSVLIRQTARVPIAALADGTPFRNSILAGFEVEGVNRHLLVAFLNSGPIRWLHYHRFRDARQGMPQLKIGHLRAMPQPPADSTAVGRELTRLAQPIADSNSGCLKQDRERIDAAVCRALDLTASEAQLVADWGRANAPPKVRARAASA